MHKSKNNILQKFLFFSLLVGTLFGVDAFALHFTDKHSENYNIPSVRGTMNMNLESVPKSN